MRPTPAAIVLALTTAACVAPGEVETEWVYTVADTGQTDCYDDAGAIPCPDAGEEFAGQDAQNVGAAPSYTDNLDGTVTDEVTGLVWEQAQNDEVPYESAAPYCDGLVLGGASDWRLPSVKEAYSLIRYDGATGTAAPEDTGAPADAVPYIDDVFDFEYGSPRYIDVQFATTSVYVSTVFADNSGSSAGQECFFGVNHADGRIKCYPTSGSWQVRCVRGNADYGTNDFEDLGDGTVADHNTGLVWMQRDSGSLAGSEGGALDWAGSLAWCEDSTEAGHDDWRLPDVKELQSLVDYARSPDTTGSAAIDPLFDATLIRDEAGDDNFAAYWTGTTHLDGRVPGTDAAYVAFGEALGYTEMAGVEGFMDVHGAGAQRGDPKTGSPDEYPQWGHGPQGDVRRVFNLARCVRALE